MLGLKGKLDNIKDWIAFDNKTEGYIDYEHLIEGSSVEEPGVDVDEDEMAVLMYTGGTTGLPKGVMHSHNTTMWSSLTALITADVRFGDRYLICLPLFHVGSRVVRLANRFL